MMTHKYLRAVGFSRVTDRALLLPLLRDVIKNPDAQECVLEQESNRILAEYRKHYGEGFGIAVRGELDKNDELLYDYYFPFLETTTVSSSGDLSVERHTEKESYAGVCDEAKLGIPLIFYLQNAMTCLMHSHNSELSLNGRKLMLSALSTEGTIMMPIFKEKAEITAMNRVSGKRKKWMADARKGDESAKQNLALQDMHTYTAISKRILKEDVYSLVDTSFMPYGVECDLYYILGEIRSVKENVNKLTKETVYVILVNCNEVPLLVCINKADLLGEPEVGRRFKGSIWLQGCIDFGKIDLKKLQQ